MDDQPASKNRRDMSILFGFLHLSLVVGGVVISRWAMPWLGSAGVLLLGIGSFPAKLTPRKFREQFSRWGLVGAWLGSLLLPTSFFLESRAFELKNYLDYYTAALAWLLSLILFLPVWQANGEVLKSRWNRLSMAWFLTGNFAWVGGAYLENNPSAFYFGVVLVVASLILLKLKFRLPFAAIQVVNTLLLLLIGLPLADGMVYGTGNRELNPEILKQYRSYEAAKKHPAAFEQWWQYFWNQWEMFAKDVVIVDRRPSSPMPFRLRPNSHGTLVQSEIRINSRGFRGKEISEVKGDTFRIVVLGESSTFGLTINPGEKSWPEMLEELIRNRLKPKRPVEIINAGIPGGVLQHNLYRFADDILPVKPDLIICYHGYNGFCHLDKTIAPTHGKRPPEYHHRPLVMLAEVEYRLKLWNYKRNASPRSYLEPPRFVNLLDSEYGRAYQELMRVAETNRIRLVLANFSMAVNSGSPAEIVEFLRPRTITAIHRDIRANKAHSELLQELASKYPQIQLIDTHPHLDGEHDKFIDLVHLTEEGDRQLSENIFAGVKEILEQELNKSADHVGE